MSLSTLPLAVPATPNGEPPEREFERADLTLLEERYQMADQSSRDQDRLARENIAFLEDIQLIHVTDRGMLNMASAALRPGKVQMIDNRLMDNARRLHARIVDARFLPDVVQETEDPSDRQAAKSARIALRWFERRNELAVLKSTVAWWAVAVGQCYLEAFFDPDAGPLHEVPVLDEATGEIVMEPAIDDAGSPIMVEEPVTDPLTGQPAVDPLTEQIVTEQKPQMRPKMTLEPLGMIDATVRSFFQVKRDPRFQEWNKLRWLFVDEPADRQEVLDRFGKPGDGLAEKLKGTEKQQPLPWVPDVARGLNPSQQDLTAVPKPPPTVSGTVTIRRYYERPSKKYPRGRHIVYLPEANVQVYPSMAEEAEQGLGTPDKDFPLVPVGYLDRPWILEARSPVTGSAKILQRVYNRLFGRMGEHLVRLAGGYLLVPTTSGIPKGAFTNEIGSIIRYMPAGGEPKMIFPQYGGLQWYEVFLNRIERSFEERMALPAVTRGQRVPGVRTWRGMELLREEADKVQSPVLVGMAWSYAKFYTKVLGLMKRHFTVARLVSFQGEANRAEATEFMSDTLPEDWRDRISVQVQSEEGMPSSKIARIELILKLSREQFAFGRDLGSPSHIRKLREALDFDAGFLTSEEDLDITIAEHENVNMRQSGQVAQVQSFDDDLVHIRTHLNDIKRNVAAGRADQVAPQQEHVKMHRQAFMVKMQLAGIPGGGGTTLQPAQPQLPGGGTPAESASRSPLAMPGAESEEGIVSSEPAA